MNEVLYFLRIEIEAVKRSQNANRCFEVGRVVFGVLDAFLYVLGRVSNFDESSLAFEFGKFWGLRFTREDVNATCGTVELGYTGCGAVEKIEVF